mmetsp:Transcript_10359/g.31181  ORF Transcript_10359/g.31181 Transcript_10359/m.31181 type:complete len:238 (+) Transcript_10359:756-1469(+)
MACMLITSHPLRLFHPCQCMIPPLPPLPCALSLLTCMIPSLLHIGSADWDSLSVRRLRSLRRERAGVARGRGRGRGVEGRSGCGPAHAHVRQHRCLRPQSWRRAHGRVPRRRSNATRGRPPGQGAAATEMGRAEKKERRGGGRSERGRLPPYAHIPPLHAAPSSPGWGCMAGCDAAASPWARIPARSTRRRRDAVVAAAFTHRVVAHRGGRVASPTPSSAPRARGGERGREINGPVE